MSPAIRDARAEDLPAVLQLTRANRQLLADLEPDFWRKAPNADAAHDPFIAHQIADAAFHARVIEDAGVVGYAATFDNPAGFFILDDVCLARDADWADAGVALFQAVDERPIIMTAPHGDTARVEACVTAGLREIGCVRFFRFDQEPAPTVWPEAVKSVSSKATPLAGVCHPWLPALRGEALHSLAHDDVALTAPLPAPPVYAPGGPVTVIDRVGGDARGPTLQRALRCAADEGSVGVILIVGVEDTELRELADAQHARRPVDIYEWPA